MNARQQITAATLGSALNATFGFDDYGYPTSSKVTYNSVDKQDYRYSFNPVTGNLNSRQNYLRSLLENFTYDDVDRLTGVSGPRNLSMTYSQNGNISTKSDIGTTAFTYGEDAGTYALTGVTSSTSVIPSATQAASYTSFDQVSTIDEGDYHAAFTYNSDQQRARMEVSQNGNTILTRWYGSSRYMKETAGSTTKEYTWIGGDAYSAPAVAVKEGSTTIWYYLLRDYLGNITHQMDASGNVVAEYNFDPWGRRRDKDTWSYILDSEPALFADRGFTGHEHLPWFNLINMNGRLYDPLVGRFLSPDKYVQFPDYTQNFNRYSYCLNNPLIYIDPTGYKTWFGNFFDWAGETMESIIKARLKISSLIRTILPSSIDALVNWDASRLDPFYQGTIPNNNYRINMGLFKTDPRRTIAGRYLQLVSRWTWELPQTIAGNRFSHLRNITWNVDNVDYYGGATLVNKNDDSEKWWGLTLGSYINSKNLVADPYIDPGFRHEYGHTLQSRLVGPLYLTRVGLPSLIGSGLDKLGLNDHSREWYETQANRMAFVYFSNHDPEALTTLPWNDNRFPRNYNPNWYWIFSRPPIRSLWWLFF
jgi:RHS repeat-associated protein